MFWKNKNKESGNDTGSIYYDNFALTDTGIVRDHNEDSIAVVRNIDGNGGLLAIVADGMGGHAGGEVASKMAVDIIATYLKKSTKIKEATLNQAISFANKAIYEHAQKESRLKGMGTTVVMLYIRKGEALWANVGDSRLYAVSSESISQISIDDVFKDSTTGKNHILTQACGTKPSVEVHSGSMKLDINNHPLQFMLCSDGLYDLINDLEIRKILGINKISLSTEILMGLAKERGGHDNISIVTIEASPSLPEKTTQEIKISHEG